MKLSNDPNKKKSQNLVKSITQLFKEKAIGESKFQLLINLVKG